MAEVVIGGALGRWFEVRYPSGMGQLEIPGPEEIPGWGK